MQANDIIYSAASFGGTPLIDAPTSWRYFNWKLEADNAAANDESLHITQALIRPDEGEQWLGHIPANVLAALRKDGALGELRNILSKNVGEIIVDSPGEFEKSSKQVCQNLRDAFADHQKDLQEHLKKELKFAGYDFGSWLVCNGISIAAAFSLAAPVAVAGMAAARAIGVPTLKQLNEKAAKLGIDHASLQSHPVAMLFDLKRQKQ